MSFTNTPYIPLQGDYISDDRYQKQAHGINGECASKAWQIEKIADSLIQVSAAVNHTKRLIVKDDLAKLFVKIKPHDYRLSVWTPECVGVS